MWEEPGTGGSAVWGAKVGFGRVARTRETGKGPQAGQRLARDPSGKSSNHFIGYDEGPFLSS